MSLTTTVQSWMHDAGPRERSLLIARTHVFAETTTDVDHICSTVSKDVFFGVPVRTREGQQLGEGTVLDGYEQVHDYYANRADTYVVLASAQVKSIGAPWFAFNESLATLRGTGTIGDIDVSGREFVVNSAVIFPTAPDGIRGEICVTRYPFADIVADTVVVPPAPDDPRTYLPLREMANCALLDRSLEVLRRGDADEIASLLSANHALAVRHDAVDGTKAVHQAVGRADAAAVLAQLFGGADDLTVVNRLTTDWYIFAEYLVKRADGTLRRLAITHPAEGAELTGTFGYGFDEA